MRSELEELKRANPVSDEEGRVWAASTVGHEARQRAIERTVMTDLSSDKPRKVRLTAVAAFAAGALAVALVAVPLFLTSRGGSGEAAALTPESILADGVVTEEEVRAAGEAVEQCMQVGGVSGSFSLEDDRDQGIFSRRGIQYDVPSEYESILESCRAEHMGQPVEGDLTFEIEHRWDAQNQPIPSELFEFDAKVVQCTEDWTDEDFGQMTQDETGATTAQGEATKRRAASAAGAEYQSCLYKVSATERNGFPGGPILFSDDSGLLVVPPGWMATHTQLTPDDDSLGEMIAVSTYRLEPGRACGGLPMQALENMSAADLLVTVSEVKSPGAANPRPGSFSSVIDGVDADPSLSRCVSTESRGQLAVLDTVSFTEEGRTLSVLVAIGSDVPDKQAGEVVDMLDSIEFAID
ncbi:MAG: hypothetical protein PVG83_07745 [Acidimicrobiia bacterium]|jgi:hypothetical protein